MAAGWLLKEARGPEKAGKGTGEGGVGWSASSMLGWEEAAPTS
jgi:hypothetical protein